MIRIGVDFGGTKIEAAALDEAGRVRARLRHANPGEYEAALQTVVGLVDEVERTCGVAASVGIGTPGSISPRTGRIRGANSLYLNDRPFQADLERALGRSVRLANDANCLALSEATDGAGEGCAVVFAAILGTGCGAGIVANGRILQGGNGAAGEWGHMPLPWLRDDERPAPTCWCGKPSCMELYVSGPGFAADYVRRGGESLSAEAVVSAAEGGDVRAAAALDAYVERLARGLAVIVDVLDPDVIVLGGGMSNVEALYRRLPAAVAPLVFSDVFETPIVPARHGDSSGVRGAAWLWASP